MKRTQRKDAWRNIRKQGVSFASIIVIALLGVAAFLSISYSAEAMKVNGSAAYDALHFRDLEVVSTLLLTEDDLECLRNTEGVSDVEPLWQTGVNAYINGQREGAAVITVTERLNRPILVEGRLPETLTECAVETRLADKAGWHLGDTVEWLEMTESTGRFFLGVEALSITGIVEHPDHVNLNVPDVLYILVYRDAFDHEAMKNCCMKALIEVDTPAGMDRFSAGYQAAVQAVRERIEALASTRAPLRDNQVRQQAYGELDEAETNYAAYLEETSASGESAPEEIDEFWAFFEQIISDQRREVDEMAPCRWIVLDSRGNTSFVQLNTSSKNLASLQMTFSMLFVAIGALVIYATVSKMVDEQRTLVGVTKALGFFNREVFAKYLLFGLLATVLGTFLGILLARFWIEGFVLNGYNIYFTIDLRQPRMFLKPTLIVILGGVFLAVAAVTFACLRLVRMPAIRLMQAPVPKGRNKTVRTQKHVLSLYSRLVLLNIRTDIKRVLVTVVSVAGCCTLVVIGFTLKYSIDKCMEKQYTEVVQYDGRIRVDYAGDVEEELISSGVEYVPLYDGNVTFRIRDVDMGELLCGDIAAIETMFRLNDWQTGEPLAPTDEGIYIQRRLAEIYDLTVGSEFEMTLNGTQTITVRVAGVFENYLGRTMAMSPGYYEALCGETPQSNAFFVRFGDVDREALLSELDETLGFVEHTPADEGKAMFKAATSVINAVVALFIFMAAVMAGVVLLNLTNIYILQKKRELTVMRINGFTTKEVIAYVTRETVITTILGIILGLIFGSAFGYRIVRALEQSFYRLERSICFSGWLYAAIMTVFFTVIVNIIALRKVKDLKLTDVA